jgi:hypothetical protein
MSVALKRGRGTQECVRHEGTHLLGEYAGTNLPPRS